MVITTVNDDTIYRNAKGQLVLKHNNDILFIDPHNGGIVGCDIKALSKSNDWELFTPVVDTATIIEDEHELIEAEIHNLKTDTDPYVPLVNAEVKRGRGRPKKNA